MIQLFYLVRVSSKGFVSRLSSIRINCLLIIYLGSTISAVGLGYVSFRENKPGSSSYVKIMSFGAGFFVGDFWHNFYTQKEDPVIAGFGENKYTPEV